MIVGFLVKKSVLCLATYFPPQATTGAHRTRALARYLPAHGWRPIVVSPQLNRGALQDPALLQGLPQDLIVYRTPSLDLLSLGTSFRDQLKRFFGRTSSAPGGTATQSSPAEQRPISQGWADWASWWLQIPDQTTGWLPYGISTAQRAVRRHRCQAIYSSAPQWTSHLIALVIKRLTRLPWVADFRDPWRSSPFRKIPWRAVDRFDAWLERRVVHDADWVVCNTNPVRADFARRYPEFAPKFITVPNGFDPEDFAELAEQRPIGTDKLLLTHAGCFYGKRRPEPLFRALGLLRDRTSAARPPSLQLVGHTMCDDTALTTLAARCGVAELVLVRGEVPHRQALELMRGSDIQLLIGFSGAGAELQVPAKLFEYLGVGRPVLALAPRQSAIADILSQSGADAEICEPEDVGEIASAIARLEARRAAARDGSSATQNASITQFHRREQVGRIAALLAGRR